MIILRYKQIESDGITLNSPDIVRCIFPRLEAVQFVHRLTLFVLELGIIPSPSTSTLQFKMSIFTKYKHTYTA